MGQKTNPIGFRIAVNKDWRSKWYAGKKDFGKLLTEDRQIRDLTTPWMTHLSALINNTGNRSRLALAYRSI